MGKKTPSTSRKQLRTSAPYVAKAESAVQPAPVPLPPPPPAAPPPPPRAAPAQHPPVPAASAVVEHPPIPAAAPLVEHPPLPAAAPVEHPPLPVAAPLVEHPPIPTASALSLLPTFDLRALARVSLGFCEAALTALPSPAEIVTGDPAAPAPPPGLVPPGDSRSMRMDSQFALIYRHGASVISRRGMIGQRGVWRVVDYPGPTQASAAYAAECSRLRGQGFVDLS
jgi:hypothetical protein